MKSVVVGLCALALAACSHSTGLPHNGDGGARTFDPCVAHPSTGFDPKSHGLPGCCTGTGPAHFVPTSDVNPTLASQLMPCDANSVCMPDPIIRGGGQYMPAMCTSSVGKAAGVCLSQCIPLVANNPQTALLGQDGCGDGELCIPCNNPLNGMPTGACSLISLICGGGDGGADAGGDGGQACPYTGPPLLDPTTLPDCSPSCGGAHCLPATLVPAAQQSLLSMCTAAGGAPGFCAPDDLIKTGGNFIPKSCTSVAGAEGRCTSTCLPSVASQAALLPKDVCADGQVCAPCYNPTASDPTKPTGACNIACDKPAQPPLVLSCPWQGPPVVDPTTFPACDPTCYGAHCVPASLVPASEQSLLTSCNGGLGFCTPDPFIASAGNFVPKSCTSIAGAEGRCLSTCLAPIAAQASLLPKDVCGQNEVCAPCFNPTASDPTAATGACTIGCDKPADPPTIISCPYDLTKNPPVVNPSPLPSCAGGACQNAHCLPSTLVPSPQAALLAPCADGKSYCTPDPIIESDNNWVPKTCKSIGGAEGRCLSLCLPSVASKAEILPQDVCATDERCAPCYDPTNNDAPTGACSLACDKPMTSPSPIACPYNLATNPPLISPSDFPSCASATCSNAHCLPADLVPAAQQSLLTLCPDGKSYCTPDPIIETANNYVPPSCTSVAGAEGRCLSTCLPSVEAMAAELPSKGCPTGTLCAPCYNPLVSPPPATGACSLGCDKPAKPPVLVTCPWNVPPNAAVLDPTTLPPCDNGGCAGSHCLPASLVPTAQRALLASCQGGTGYCTPDPIIASGNNWNPPKCTSVAGAEGRCLSTCLPSVAKDAEILPQSVCAAGTKCAPCYDPTQPGTPSTGACNLGCDKPTQPPVVLACVWDVPPHADVIIPTQLPSCAGGDCTNAHCLPSAFVPTSQQSQLSACGSGATAGYCAPDVIIQSGGFDKPPACNVFGQSVIEGRCLSECLPQIDNEVKAGQLFADGCPSGDACAPCYNPFDGRDTSACESSSCDKPVNSAYTFPDCCFYNGQAQGRCLPPEPVGSNSSNLNQDVCQSGWYCVPDENLPGGTGQACHVSFTIVPPFNYNGSCISDCAKLGLGNLYPQANCPGNFTCIHCSSAPAGSTGC